MLPFRQAGGPQDEISPSKVRTNIAANMVGRIWGVVSVYLFIPLYLRFLGPEAYGLVGFYATLLAVLAFADLGLSATLTREMARLAISKDSGQEQADLLRTYESAYAWISFIVAIVIYILAPLIASHWLRSSALGVEAIIPAIRLMSVSIALQLPSNLYVGGLMGLQRQVLTNSIQVVWSLSRGVGAILVLWLVSRTVDAYFVWQLLCAIVYCFAVRSTLWRAIAHKETRPRFKWLVFRRTWRYAFGMASMALFSTILTQTDKLAVSKLLPLKTLGFYMLAVAIGGVPRMLASTIGPAIFPRLTGLVAAGDLQGVCRLYHRAATLVSIAVIPAGLTLALFSSDFLLAWTGNASAAQQVGLAAAYLVIGEAMQALMTPAFYVVLAHGNVRLTLYMQIVSVALITPLLIFLITKYGVVGAGVSWVVMNLCTLPFFIHFVDRRFMPGEWKKWYLSDIGAPLLASLPCVLLGRWWAPHSNSRVLLLALIALIWGVAAAAAASTSSELRSVFLKRTFRILRTLHAAS